MMEPSLARELRVAELFARLQAALADRYTIERELGRGGMAMVRRRTLPPQNRDRGRLVATS